MNDDLEFRIAKLALRPGDVLVAKFNDRPLSMAQAQHIRETFNRAAPGMHVLILDKGTDLAVLTREEIEARVAA